MRPTLALATSLAVLAAATTATAAPPPRGNYGCSYSTLSGTFYAGTLNILSRSTYSVNKRRKGRYRTAGRKLIFKTGDYRTLYYGRWSRVKNVLSPGYSHKIELFGKKDGEQKLTCSKSG